VARHLFLGPFLSLSIGRYDEAWTDCDGEICSASDFDELEIDETALHDWLVLGVRGT
jgi:hypothetical protein